MIPGNVFRKINNERMLKNQSTGSSDQHLHCVAGCGSVNSNAVKQALEETVEIKLEKSCKVKGVGCGAVFTGPLLTLYSKDKAPVIYQKSP